MDRGVDDIRLAFDRVPALYDRVRPDYPEELLDQLFVALPPEPAMVEVGPGTGQATGPLLRRGAWVTAVEYGPDLADYLVKKLGRHERLHVVNRSFEDVELPASSFDAIVSATAYHWISGQMQVRRPCELLRPGGVLAIIDLIQVESKTDLGYFRRVQPIYDSYGRGSTPTVAETYENAMPPIVGRLDASGQFGKAEVYRVPWDQTYTTMQYRDLLMTYSGTQKMPEPQRTEMVEQLVAVIEEEFGGNVTRPLVATLTIAPLA